MIDTFALLLSHGMLVLVVLRLFKIRDPALPELPGDKKKKKALPIRPGGRTRA